MKFLKWITTVTFVIFCGMAHAQDNPTPQESQPDLETIQKHVNELNSATEELAGELAKDPNLEVTSTEDAIYVKKRTHPTIDTQIDPKELKSVENLQGFINFSFFKGRSWVPSKAYDGHRPEGITNDLKRSSTIGTEFSVRPPVRQLKRLMVGLGMSMESAGTYSAPEGTHTLGRGFNYNVDFSYFANWDVLVLRRARALVSVGYRRGSYDIIDFQSEGNSYSMDVIKAKEHTFQTRYNQLLYTSGEGNVGFFGQYGRSLNGTNTMTFGFTIMYGPPWKWLKALKTK